MGCLVDPGECSEGDTRSPLADVARDLCPHLSIDLEPTGNVSGEMRSCRPRRERDATPDSIGSTEPPAYDAEGTKRRTSELEQRWRRRVEVTVDVAHLGADIATAIAESTCGFARPIEPAQSRQSERPGITSEQEGRVGRTRDRWERRGDGAERAFFAESSQRGEKAVVYSAFENIRTCSIGEKNDDRQGSIERVSVRDSREICLVNACEIVTRQWRRWSRPR